MSKKRIKKLTPAQKKEIWKPTEQNVGAGWEPKGNFDEFPRKEYERITPPRLDEIFKGGKP